MRFARVVALVILLACGVMPVPPRPFPTAHAAVRLRAAIVADTTLEAVGAWTLPPRSSDSITANVTNVVAGGWFHVKLAPTAVGVTVRQAIPDRDATYDVVLQVCTWRGNKPPECVEARQNVAYSAAGPLPVQGLTLDVRRIP